MFMKLFQRNFRFLCIHKLWIEKSFLDPDLITLLFALILSRIQDKFLKQYLWIYSVDNIIALILFE